MQMCLLVLRNGCIDLLLMIVYVIIVRHLLLILLSHHVILVLVGYVLWVSPLMRWISDIALLIWIWRSWSILNLSIRLRILLHLSSAPIHYETTQWILWNEGSVYLIYSSIVTYTYMISKLNSKNLTYQVNILRDGEEPTIYVILILV